MSAYIMAAIEWCIVPLILPAIFLFALFGIPGNAADSQVKASARAGKWAGLILLVIFIVSQKNRPLAFSFKIPSYDFLLVPLLLSGLAGFFFSWIFDVIKRTRVIGFFVLALIAATTITFYSYLFISSIRSMIVFVALGIMLGVLMHEVFFPGSIAQMKNQSNKTPQN